jgi:hypothetical protein
MQATELLETMFAPAERATPEELSSQISLFADTTTSMPGIWDLAMDLVLILNRCRQIVFCNTAVTKTFGLADPEKIYGLRPGEAVGCVNSARQAGGCGTDEHCSVCGAVNAVMVALAGKEHVGECHILCHGGEALDLLIKTTPLKLSNDELILVALRDNSTLNRQRIMERIFYHDVLNTAFGVKMLAESSTWSKRANDILRKVHISTLRFIEEINAQKDLTAAESGELTLKETAFSSSQLVDELVEGWVPFAEARNCTLRLGKPLHNAQIVTDRRLLGRVICNMLKNAIEASTSGQKVECFCTADEEAVRFCVSNQACMPRQHQLQVFQRSFSTKGDGRGLGTYSMRLITEKYLRGKMSFTSSEEAGTVFVATIPLETHSTPSAG